MKRETNKWLLQKKWLLLLFVILFFSTRLGGFFTLKISGNCLFWSTNAILLALVLKLPPNRRVGVLCFCSIPIFLGELWIGFPLLHSAIYTLTNLLNVSLAAYIVVSSN